MDVLLIPLLTVLNTVIGIYVWIIIANAVMSWLISFQVINRKNNLVIMVSEFLSRVTEPLLARVRNLLPTMGAMDFSPLVVIVIAWFIQAVIRMLMFKMAPILPLIG